MRAAHLLLLALMVPIPALPQTPALDSLPFDEWLKGKDNARIDWSLSTSRAFLSESQRLLASVFVEVKNEELRKRSRPGELVAMVQIRDQESNTYRSRMSSGFSYGRGRGRGSPGVGATWSARAFLVPGDYEFTAAVYDTTTKEHSVKRTHLHVAALSHDPLPDSWRGISSVVLASNFAPLPRLSLPVETKRPVRVEVILTQPVIGDQAGNLMARLEVISQMTIRNGSMGLRVLDLARQKILFSQEAGEPLDMREVGAALDRGDPRIVHADVLSKYYEGAQFLSDQVRAALESKEPGVAHVVMVLSAPWNFPKDEDVPVLQVALPPQSRVFYIRCDSPSYSRYTPSPADDLKLRNATKGRSSGVGGPDGPGLVRINADNSDSLAGILKLLPARIFDVSDPAAFRRALGDIVREISQIN